MDAKTTEETAAFSIHGFCAAHNISRAFYYELLRKGKGPRLMKVGRRKLISCEAAAEWRRRMEAEAEAEDTARAA